MSRLMCLKPAHPDGYLPVEGRVRGEESGGGGGGEKHFIGVQNLPPPTMTRVLAVIDQALDGMQK